MPEPRELEPREEEVVREILRDHLQDHEMPEPERLFLGGKEYSKYVKKLVVKQGADDEDEEGDVFERRIECMLRMCNCVYIISFT